MDQLKSILFISYWGYYDGLTQATVLPHLKILADSPLVEKIVLVTIERNNDKQLPKGNEYGSKFFFIPYHSRKRSHVFLTKFDDYLQLPAFLKTIIINYNINIIIARSAPAGNIAVVLHNETKIPFYVESFEPHADYMFESGVWKKWDPRYWVQKLGEKQIKKLSSGLMTVSHNYAKQLQKENIDSAKIIVVPCTVDINKFKFDEHDRKIIRAKHHIPENAMVGINVGKYGSIYHDNKAFQLFSNAFKYFNNYWQLLITPDTEQAGKFMIAYNLPVEKCIILTLHHHEVPSYLAAADFAYVLIKTSPAKKYCSPIKTGEYWANGLPVIITEGIGDDSSIVSDSGWGAVWDGMEAGSEFVFQQINTILQNINHRSHIQALAAEHRHRDFITEGYRSFFII